MKVIAVLSLLAAFASAEADLGPWARPGVPVLLGGELRYPNRLPWSPDGAEDGDAFEAVAADRVLVAYAGMEPWTPDGVRVRLPAVRDLWPALDVFDRIVLPRADACTAAVRAWVRAGGELVVPDADPLDGDHGLGAVQVAASADEAPPARPHPVPRPGLARPDVYDLLPPPGGPAPALERARRVFWAVAAVLALHLLLLATGRVRGRAAWGALGALVLVGAAVGFAVPRAVYEPTARGSVVVRYLKDGWGREREYRVFGHLGPGATWPAGAGAPVYYGSNREPWPRELEPGITRMVRVDRVLRAGPTLEPVASILEARRTRPAVRLLKEAEPRGRLWRAGASEGVRPPGAVDRELARLEVVLTD